ncbi:uncharacterized protein LOC125052201 isoform X2 [Pieris napi]|uniref:uncharacterized protein LOC125052201 isoform X2 n=1 Tax=Pieris napi TaxID=78633 RepID=UPI001FB91830|nr:uncharacterized protein LOC125052201 isoform X2 [Pieris napi]
MNESTNKRVRSSNWDDYDKEVLRTLALQRAEILEKKDTTTKVNAAKKKAWEEVVTRVSRNKRDLPQILNQWRNMKTRAKSMSNERRDSSSTSNEFILPEVELIVEPEASTVREVFSAGSTSKKPKKKNSLKSNCCNQDHEHEIYLLAKKSREEVMWQQRQLHETRMQQEKEIHEKRIDLMRLEEEYWRLKMKRIYET